jgi:hypothetical protein
MKTKYVPKLSKAEREAAIKAFNDEFSRSPQWQKFCEAAQSRFKNNPDAPAWNALVGLLEVAKQDPRISASKGVCDAIDVLVLTFGDWPSPGTEFDEIASIIGTERARDSVKKRGDQKEKKRFQGWIIEKEIRLSQMADLLEMKTSQVPADVLAIMRGRPKSTIKDWYKEIRPEPMKPGRRA